jgi:hypothetical protein
MQLIIIGTPSLENDDRRFWIGILSLIRLVRLLRLISVSKVSLGFSVKKTVG